MSTLITIDFETRSQVDLKSAGAWAYAEHPSTEIMCMVSRVGNKGYALWVPQKFLAIVGSQMPQDLQSHIISKLDMPTAHKAFSTKKVEAHNAMFERAHWEKIMVKRHGFPEVPPENWRCSAAKAAAYSLPRSLDGACSALGLKTQKDKEGYFLMLKMCKPKSIDPETGAPVWVEDAESLIRLFRYCIQDVEAEHALSQALSDLSPMEQKVWHMDQAINARGVKIDRIACEAASKIVTVCEADITERISPLTDGAVTKATQVAKILKWMAGKGFTMKDLTKASVSDALLKKNLLPEVRKMLEIRKVGGKSSTAKLKAFDKRMCTDDRARDLFVFHGAGTGRWAGKGPQPQNMPRPTFDDTEGCLDLVQTEGREAVNLVYGDPMQAVSSCLRGMFIPDRGMDFICADFSSIEARVLAWICGEIRILKSFEDDVSLYKLEATGIFNVKYDEVEKFQRLVGKVATLALGYQGGWSAFMAMSKGYGLTPPDEFLEAEYAPRMYKGLRKRLTQEEVAFKVWASPFVTAWRENRPAVVEFWWSMESLAKVVIETGKAKSYKGIAFGMKDGFLQCRLPSGRFMRYYDPTIVTKEKEFINKEGEKYKKTVRSITFMGINSLTKKWERKETYGGKLTENIVQATANDLLREALLRVEAAGYPTVLHVHDEGVAEVPEGFGSLEEYETLMAVQPAWAKGLPLKAEGWRGKRYRK